MISHVFIGVSDFRRAVEFYTRIPSELGLVMKFIEPENQFLIGKPYNGQPAHPGNGQMVALLAKSREVVDHVYASALSLGASSEGAPGLRRHYHPNYYGGYFRDLDGNKICVCCHDPD